MNTPELFVNLTRQGVQLAADNGKLSIRSPKGVLTPELRAELAARKEEFLVLLQEMDVTAGSTPVSLDQGLSLETIGRLIGGFGQQSATDFKPPIIDTRAMAEKLVVTFKPLPVGYKNKEVIRFREELEVKLRDYGVKVEPWHQATTDFKYEITIPGVKWTRNIKTRLIKTGTSAVIDVESLPSLRRAAETFSAEKLYQIYSYFAKKHQKDSIMRIAKLISWAEEHAAKYLEDPMNTQVIMLTEINRELTDPNLPYQDKIKIGLTTLIKNFSQIVVGISSEKITILNMNLSDSVYLRDDVESFILKSFIPKIFVPILPLPLSRFEIGKYKPDQSAYAEKLAALGKSLAQTGLFPAGSKLSEVIKRRSHRDIVNIIVNGRTGVSYGFVAYAEPPQYIGEPEITEQEWERLFPSKGFSVDEVRQNDIGRRYVKTRIREAYVFKQVPDIWLVSSRSGSNKTDLKLERDIVRIGLTSNLLLQLPETIDPKTTDVKPSYDIYVMLAITLSAALYTPELIKNGAAIAHFHGYPTFEWLRPNEYCVGVNNPSVPCGTYESGIFNFMGISSLTNQQVKDICLVGLIEPDHGTNVIAYDWEYLVERLRDGCVEGQIELGGRHFATLKEKLGDRCI